MYCPRCGQEQISNETRFCSRCGFLLTGVADLIANNGAPATTEPNPAKPDTPRKRGLKKGLFIFLLTFLVVPIISIVTVWLRAEPFAVVISSILLFVGGLLRMAYAWLFESNVAPEPAADSFQTAPNLFNKRQEPPALPAAQSIPASSYMPPVQGNWRETNDLEPSSVTDPTTKLLQKEQPSERR